MIAVIIVLSLLLLGSFLVMAIALISGKEAEEELLAAEVDNEYLRRQNYELKLQCQKLETRLTLTARN